MGGRGRLGGLRDRTVTFLSEIELMYLLKFDHAAFPRLIFYETECLWVLGGLLHTVSNTNRSFLASGENVTAVFHHFLIFYK